MMMAIAFQRGLEKSFGRLYCGKSNHRSTDCFKILDIAHRRVILKKTNRCFNCTGIGHITSKCRSRGCIECGGRHHISLCDNGPEVKQQNKSDFNQGSEKWLRAMDESTTLHTLEIAKVNGVSARIMLGSRARSFMSAQIS